VDALRAVATYMFGSAVLDAPRRLEPDPARRESESIAAFSERTELSRVTRLAEPLAQCPAADAFEIGLRWLIDGIGQSASGLPTSRARPTSRATTR
jgi:hypothetical protein